MVRCITHIGRYEIVGELGRGAMGMVVKARDPLIDRFVALKTTVCHTFAPGAEEECESRFFAEAKCAGRLNHPNIIAVHDAGHDGEVAYMAMEFVDGSSLRQLLDSGVVLVPDRIAEIAARVADALAFAHAQDIVHCDVKPSNVMLLDDGGVKLADFGAALLPGGPLCAEGTVIGSPKYMSPEQATGIALDGRSDIFSLGTVLYEMLTGRPPFTGGNLDTLLQQVLTADPMAPSSRMRSLHAGFDVIVGKALAKDPNKRYQTAAEMAADLRSYRELGAHAATPKRALAYVAPKPTTRRAGATVPLKPKRMDRAAMATAAVLTAIVAGRVIQPALVNSSVAGVSLGAQLAAVQPSDAKALPRNAQEAAHQTLVAAKAERARKTSSRNRSSDAGGLVKTKANQSEHASAPMAPSPLATDASRRTEAATQATTVAAAKPEKAVSPEQLCADRGNFLSRGFCEVRLCMQAEWVSDAFCVKKREKDFQSNPMLAGGR